MSADLMNSSRRFAVSRHAANPVAVNGVAISRSAIAMEVQNFSGRTPLESWQAAARALAIRELLLQEARRLEIRVDQRSDEQGRKETDEDARLRGLIEREVKTPQADEETLCRFYDKNRSRFATAPLYEVQHILISARSSDAVAYAAAREKIQSIAAILGEAPDRFSELARSMSDCPSAEVDGMLGQLAPGDTTPEFERALAGLAPGEISAPVETRYGFHLIRLERKIAGRHLSFEVVKERIATYLEAHARRRATAQYISLLLGRAEIVGITLEGATSPLVQ